MSFIQRVPFKPLLCDSSFPSILSRDGPHHRKQEDEGGSAGLIIWRRVVETRQIKHTLPPRGDGGVQKTGDVIREEVGRHFTGAIRGGLGI